MTPLTLAVVFAIGLYTGVSMNKGISTRMAIGISLIGLCAHFFITSTIFMIVDMF